MADEPKMSDDENEANEIVHNANVCYQTAEYLADQATEIQRLKAEVERLRAENAEMRPIVAAVADAYDADREVIWLKSPAWNFIEQARAFVAANGETTYVSDYCEPETARHDLCTDGGCLCACHSSRASE